MNVIFIDLEPVPDAQIGDWVTLWAMSICALTKLRNMPGLGAEAIQCGLTKKHRVHLIDEDQLCGT